MKRGIDMNPESAMENLGIGTPVSESSKHWSF
jgi:hypothetical protein